MDKLAALRALPWEIVEAAAKAGGVQAEGLASLKAMHAGERADAVGLNLGITFNLKKFDHKPDGKKYLAEIITGSDVDGGFDSTRTVVNSDTAEEENTHMKVVALVEGSVAGKSFAVGDTLDVSGDTARGWFHRAFIKPADEEAIRHFNQYAKDSPDEYAGAVQRIKDREAEIEAAAKAAKEAADAAAAAPPVPVEAVPEGVEQWPVDTATPAATPTAG